MWRVQCRRWVWRGRPMRPSFPRGVDQPLMLDRPDGARLQKDDDGLVRGGL